MEVNFKFEIGQFVYMRQEVLAWEERYGRVIEQRQERRGYETLGDLTAQERRPFGMQVIERHFQQCYGGIQLHYHLRSGGQLVSMTEPELTADATEFATAEQRTSAPR